MILPESKDGVANDGEGEAWLVTADGVESLPEPPAMPRSVANLYFRIFALDMREVK